MTQQLLATPNGLAQITQTFGDINKFVRSDGTIDPKWEQNMVAVPIPFSIPLSSAKGFRAALQIALSAWA